jgi:hypothetical protein
LGLDDRGELIRPEIIIKALRSKLHSGLQQSFRHYSWQQKRHIAKATARARDQYLGSVEQVRFEYALILGFLTTETYLKLMEWQAEIWHNYA